MAPGDIKSELSPSAQAENNRANPDGSGRGTLNPINAAREMPD
jgi:hypothetical protein